MALLFTNGTLAQWTAAGKVLLNGQLGVLRNADGTAQIKIGNGVDTWASLPEQDSVKLSAQTLTSGQQTQARANIGLPLPAIAQAAIQHVSSAGNDSADGLTPGTAKATVAAAVTALRAVGGGAGGATGGIIQLGKGSRTL